MDFSAAGKTVKGSPSGKGHGFRGRYRLIVASNRDEYLDRATAPIHFWKDANQNLLAGVCTCEGDSSFAVVNSAPLRMRENLQEPSRNVAIRFFLVQGTPGKKLRGI